MPSRNVFGLPVLAILVSACTVTAAVAQTRDVAGNRDYPGIGRFTGGDHHRICGEGFRRGADAGGEPSRTASPPTRGGSRAASSASPTAPIPAPRSWKCPEISRRSLPKPASRPCCACDADACGAIPFTESVDTLPIPQMWVDGFNYRYYAGRKTEGGRETYASVVVSQNNRGHLRAGHRRRARRDPEQDGRRCRHGEGLRRDRPHRALRHLFRHRQGRAASRKAARHWSRSQSCSPASRSSTSSSSATPTAGVPMSTISISRSVAPKPSRPSS